MELAARFLVFVRIEAAAEEDVDEGGFRIGVETCVERPFDLRSSAEISPANLHLFAGFFPVIILEGFFEFVPDSFPVRRNDDQFVGRAAECSEEKDQKRKGDRAQVRSDGSWKMGEHGRRGWSD